MKTSLGIIVLSCLKFKIMKITKFVLFILICMLSINQACKPSTAIRKQKKYEKAAEKAAKKAQKFMKPG